MKRRNFLKQTGSTGLSLGGALIFGQALASTGAETATAIGSGSGNAPGSVGILSAKHGAEGAAAAVDSELVKSMHLAAQNLIDSLNPEQNYTPYWELRIDPDYKAAFNMWWPQHNIGRWWDAMLRLEKATGFKIPARQEKAMLENVKLFFDNPDHLCFQPLNFDKEVFMLELHSLREGVIALNALIRYRDNKWAREKGHKMLQTLEAISLDDGSWDYTKLDYYQKVKGKMADFLPGAVETNGRLIESLIWYYESTGDPIALRLARKYSEWHYENTTNPDGSIKTEKPDHTHSYLGTLRGLFLYGKLTRQHKYIDRVAKSYEKTVLTVVKESGFTSHDLGQEKRGETTSPGDAAQLGLWLGLDGYSRFLDDAERLVRARLLPCQITETPSLIPRKNDNEDRYKNLTKRVIGGYGGMHTLPHGGKMDTTDITAAVLHTMADIYEHVVQKDADMTFLNFHFNYSDKDLSVKVTEDDKRIVHVTNKKTGPLMIRIPAWAPRETISLEVNGKKRQPVYIDNFLLIDELAKDHTVQLTFGLPEKTIVETTDGTDFRIHWKGDTITGIAPNVKQYPFYPDL